MTSIGPNAAEGGAADTGAKPVPRQVFLRVAARSWWVVAMGLVLGAVAGLVQARAAPPLYQADVVVVASTTTIPVESFGSLATTAFNTDTVLDPVIRSLRLDTTPHGLIAGQELSVQQVSGAAAIRVIGQASNARLASALANTAAQSFVTAATRSGLGSFTLFGGGAPGTRTPVATTSTVARDALAGVLVSLLLILLLVMWRRPVFSGADVGQELGVDVVVEARVRRAWLRRGSAGSF